MSLENVVFMQLCKLHVGVFPHSVDIVPVLFSNAARTFPFLKPRLSRLLLLLAGVSFPESLQLQAVVVSYLLTLLRVVLSQLLQLPDPVLLDALHGGRQPLDLGRRLSLAAGAACPAVTAAIVPGEVMDQLAKKTKREKPKSSH